MSPLISTWYFELAPMFRLPSTLMVPIELPGDTLPPLMWTLPNVPLPDSVPPVLTLTTDELFIEPLTLRLPASMFVAPVYPGCR